LEKRLKSEVDTGSREENASKQETGASFLIQSEPKLWRITRSGGTGFPEDSGRLRAQVR
jgi:hypothetical protein